MSMSMHLMPIESSQNNYDQDADEKITSGYHKKENDASEVTECDLSDVSPQDVMDELTRIVPQMAKDVRANDAAYVEEAVSKFRDLGETGQLANHLVSLDLVEIYQRYLKENFNMIDDADLVNTEEWDTAELLLMAMWNLSNKCSVVCERILEVGLHADLLDFIKSDFLSPARMNEEIPRSIVKSCFGILHNVVQEADGAWDELRACGAVERLQPFRLCGNTMVACVSLMIQSYLVTEEENEKINSSEDIFQLLVTLLDAAIQQQWYNAVKFAVIEVLEALNNLAANENNKLRIVKSGALPYYVDLMGPERPPEEQAEAAYGLWSLAFNCKDEIRQQKGTIKGLKSLLKSPNENIRKQAAGALWILEGNDEIVPQLKDQEAQDGHVFISYQWDSKETVLKIRDQLKAAGFRVWIDEDNMSGNVMDAMAAAVEKAAVVVLCVSQKYKMSPNCRAEAEYTFRLKKQVVPIRLQSKYYPDGWLGMMLGSKLVRDFSDPVKAEGSIIHLIREIGNVGKGTDEIDSVKPVSIPVNNASNSTSRDETSWLKSWTKNEVKKWVTDNNLERVKKWFSAFDGPLLLEYNSMRLEAPEAFFNYLLKKNISLPDALAISHALKNLPTYCELRGATQKPSAWKPK